MSSTVSHPGEHDVLCGRGAMTNLHPGNRAFRELVARHQPSYVEAKKEAKEGISRAIVAEIQGRGGNFVMKDQASGDWLPVDHKKAILKTSQALREGMNVRSKAMTGETSSSPTRSATSPNTQKTKKNRKSASSLPLAIQPIAPRPAAAPKIHSPSNSTNAMPTSSSSSPASNINSPSKKPRSNSNNNNSSPTKKKSTTGSSSDNNNNNHGVTVPENDSLTDNDVLCGRGGGTNAYVGNIKFRAVVSDYQPRYLVCKRAEKETIAAAIVQTIRQRGGRFLSKNQDGQWEEVGDKKAILKCSQALREGMHVRSGKLKAPERQSKFAAAMMEAKQQPPALLPPPSSPQQSLLHARRPHHQLQHPSPLLPPPSKANTAATIVAKLPTMPRPQLEAVARAMLCSGSSEAIDAAVNAVNGASTVV